LMRSKISMAGKPVSSDSQATICSHKSLFLILFAAHHPNHHLSIVCQTTAERKSEEMAFYARLADRSSTDILYLQLYLAVRYTLIDARHRREVSPHFMLLSTKKNQHSRPIPAFPGLWVRPFAAPQTSVLREGRLCQAGRAPPHPGFFTE
jgi:hypothetical protein